MSKIVLITGGSRGIGAACVRRFSKEGWQVAFIYRSSREKAEALAGETGALAVCADISSEKSIEAAFATVEAKLGSVDVLVNNAGISFISMFSDTTEEDWDRVMDTNLKSVYFCCRRAIGSMVHKKAGAIVNVASMWGEVGASCEVAYSASKGAVIAFTKALAKELGPSGIRVNCVSPGVIDTDMNSSIDSDTMLGLAEETPLCRLGRPEEVADAIYYLAAGAGFITGQVLGVSGGLII